MTCHDLLFSLLTWGSCSGPSAHRAFRGAAEILLEIRLLEDMGLLCLERGSGGRAGRT